MKIKDLRIPGLMPYIKEALELFERKFIHKGEDGDDPKEKWSWNIKGSYPSEVETEIEIIIQGAYSQGYQDGASAEATKF